MFQTLAPPFLVPSEKLKILRTSKGLSLFWSHISPNCGLLFSCIQISLALDLFQRLLGQTTSSHKPSNLVQTQSTSPKPSFVAMIQHVLSSL